VRVEKRARSERRSDREEEEKRSESLGHIYTS
jgi:hypothetical protein